MLAAVTNVLGTEVLGAIAWDPEIRNILSVIVGLGVLVGSVYLIIATDTGIRTGLLVALACLFGWMATMGVFWWIYGIGMQGDAPAWHVEEVNYSEPDYSGLHEATIEEAHQLSRLDELPTAQDILAERPELVDEILPPDLEGEERDARAELISLGQIIEADPDLVDELGFDDGLGDWDLLPVSDRQRGDAVATADAFLGEGGRGLFETSSDYVVLDAFSAGGKPQREDDSLWGRFTHKLSTTIKFWHPTHYAAVQVRGVVPQETEPGQAPPPPVIDEDAPVVSVVMIRDLGDRRFPAFMVTLIFGGMFGLTCWSLHRRDKVIAAARLAGT